MIFIVFESTLPNVIYIQNVMFLDIYFLLLLCPLARKKRHLPLKQYESLLLFVGFRSVTLWMFNIWDDHIYRLEMKKKKVF